MRPAALRAPALRAAGRLRCCSCTRAPLLVLLVLVLAGVSDLSRAQFRPVLGVSHPPPVTAAAPHVSCDLNWLADLGL
jgi:hypothetical protein